jgi:dipeptidyl aminopeptidase/acylaminoacyl peptidase
MRAGDTPTELVLYPGEDHTFLGEGKPSCRSDAASRIVDWITRHACKEENKAGTKSV